MTMATDIWKVQARDRQQEICNLLTEYDWESYKISEKEYLQKKVQFVLFGPNQITLDAETQANIKKISAAILKEGYRGNCLNGETCMAFIYVFWTENGEELKCWPVFKVPKNKSNSDAYFIDINSRVYSSWIDFLENNQFPSCDYCYPSCGEYRIDADDRVILEFGKSPASRPAKAVVQYLDYANAGLALGTTAVAAASLFVPVAGPLLQASMWLTRGICAYTTMRSGSTLYDRGMHKQSVGLEDGESRNCWLSIGATALGVASSSATAVTAKVARSGQVMGRVGCATVTAITFSNVAWNGLGILNGFHNLLERNKRDQVTSLDIFHFSASLLLFAHAAVNVETARTIIEKTQNNVILDFENNLRSNRHRKMFRKVVRNTKYEKNTIAGNAQVIRSLNHINNVDDFFAALVRMNKQFGPTQSRATFTDGGLITINENLSIDPTRLVQATAEQRIIILETTKKYAGNQISEAEFKGLTESIIGKTAPVTDQRGPQLGKMITFKEALGLGKTKGNRLQKLGPEFAYPLLSAYEKLELMSLLKKFAESDHEQILRIATTLLKALGWNTGLQYVEVAYFVCGLIRSIACESKIKNNMIDNRNVMSTTEYCQAALRESLKDPSKLVQIFNHIKLLFDALSQKNTMPTQYRHIGLFEIAQLASILLVMDQPLWLRIITFSEQVFSILGLQKPIMIFNVVKGLCLNIQQMLRDMERNIERENYFSQGDYVPQLGWSEASKEISRNQCCTILNTFTEDREICDSLIKEIRKNHIPDMSVESMETSAEFIYTEEQPLVIERSFWNNCELQLISEEEILNICKQCLCTELWPTDCNVQYDWSKILVNIDDKLIVIECNFDTDKIRAYVTTATV